MKQKMLIHFQKQRGDFIAKGVGKRDGANFILLAELPGKEVFYAATIESSLSKRYTDNRANQLRELSLVKMKGNEEKFLQILLDDGALLDLREENYFLLFHLPCSEADTEDYMLVFNHPTLLRSGAHYQFFPDDGKNQNAIALFWLMKDFVRCEKGKW